MRATLNRILSNADLSRAALKAFTDWPALEQVAVQFLQFVTPWLVVGNESLAETTLREALQTYEKNLASGYEIAHRRFIERLAESANTLSCLRVSVKNSRDQWAVWNYDEPLTTYLELHNRVSIQIRERDTPVASGPVMIKLLAFISSTQELQMAEINIHELLGMKVTS